MANDLHTVRDLVEHLTTLGLDRALIVDVDGNTFPPNTDDINLWNPTDVDSPVAIMTIDWLN
uniref:Uncharacterized protein n=1 Tax=viral metagenome TaxID=1070528 RepID=A0A6H2A336_9ZZZZ